MAMGLVTPYNQMDVMLFGTANRQWNDASAGNIMFCLCSSAYTPVLTHTQTNNLTGLITTGGGAPIAATSLVLENVSVPGTTFFDSNDAVWTVTAIISPKYLIAVQPVVANTFSATTSKLLFYVDLNTDSSGATFSSSATELYIFAPIGGWFKTV